jgi:hypothetical protein
MKSTSTIPLFTTTPSSSKIPITASESIGEPVNSKNHHTPMNDSGIDGSTLSGSTKDSNRKPISRKMKIVDSSRRADQVAHQARWPRARCGPRRS